MDEATSAPATSAPIWDPLGRILPFPVPALFDARLTATHHQVLLFMAYQSEHSPDGWFEIRQDDMARFLGKETRGAVSRKLLDLCHWPTTDNPYVLRFQQVHASSRMRRANRYRLRFDVSMEDIPPELRRIAPPTGQLPDDDDSQPRMRLWLSRWIFTIGSTSISLMGGGGGRKPATPSHQGDGHHKTQAPRNSMQEATTTSRQRDPRRAAHHGNGGYPSNLVSGGII